MNGNRLSSEHAVATLAIAGVGLIAAALMSRATRRPPYSFQNRSVVITGGARGFGFALARGLARERARLVLLSRSPGDLERAQFRLKALGADVATFECDVRDEAAVEDVVRRIVHLRSGIDADQQRGRDSDDAVRSCDARGLRRVASDTLLGTAVPHPRESSPLETFAWPHSQHSSVGPWRGQRPV